MTPQSFLTRRRIVIPTIAVLLAAVVLSGCGHNSEDPWKDVPGGQPRVLVSFAPLYCFAKAVAGPKVAVHPLLTTVGPHDHQADADDILAAQKADLFLVNGLTLDDFVTKVANSSGNSKKGLVQKLGEAIPTDQLIHTDEEEAHAHHGHHHAHGEYDPHVWLGLPEAKVMVTAIGKLLAERDPVHAADYKKRAEDFAKKLDELAAYGKEKFASKKNRKFITNHHSFRYFARSFGLEVLDSIQMQAGVEPDGQQIAKLAELCKKHNIRVIGVEPQYSKAAAETLQKSLKESIPELIIVELDPIETANAEQLKPEYYLERMKQNVDNLAKHLK